MRKGESRKVSSKNGFNNNVRGIDKVCCENMESKNEFLDINPISGIF